SLLSPPFPTRRSSDLRIVMGQESAYHRMAALVIRGQLRFARRHQPTPPLGSGTDTIDRFFNFGHSDGSFVVSSGENCRFIQHVRSEEHTSELQSPYDL